MCNLQALSNGATREEVNAARTGDPREKVSLIRQLQIELEEVEKQLQNLESNYPQAPPGMEGLLVKAKKRAGSPKKKTQSASTSRSLSSAGGGRSSFKASPSTSKSDARPLPATINTPSSVPSTKKVSLRPTTAPSPANAKEAKAKQEALHKVRPSSSGTRLLFFCVSVSLNPPLSHTFSVHTIKCSRVFSWWEVNCRV